MCLLSHNFCTYYKNLPLKGRSKQGWRSGESARLPPMWPGFNSWSRCHMWVEFVVGSRPCSDRFFSGYSGFLLSSKTNISKFQFNPESEGHRFVSPRLIGVTLISVECFARTECKLKRCKYSICHEMRT